MTTSHYERYADDFTRRVHAVDPTGWTRPAPCEGWVARDVVGHLVEWVPGFFQHFAQLTTPPLPSVAVDPVAAWDAFDSLVRSWLHDDSVAARKIDTPMGNMTILAAIEQFVSPDVLLHTWDLARAAGLDDRLDQSELAAMLEGMKPIDEVLRTSGHYGPRVLVADDAPVQDKLLAFVGRDPAWTPPR